jgi:hypothetical protein
MSRAYEIREKIRAETTAEKVKHSGDGPTRTIKAPAVKSNADSLSLDDNETVAEDMSSESDREHEVKRRQVVNPLARSMRQV